MGNYHLCYLHVILSDMIAFPLLYVSEPVCVQNPTIDDRKKMVQIIKYIKGTSKYKLVLLVYNICY